MQAGVVAKNSKSASYALDLFSKALSEIFKFTNAYHMTLINSSQPISSQEQEAAAVEVAKRGTSDSHMTPAGSAGARQTMYMEFKSLLNCDFEFHSFIVSTRCFLPMPALQAANSTHRSRFKLKQLQTKIPVLPYPALDGPSSARNWSLSIQ